MKRPLLISLSLVALSACTQPAAVVELRGSQSFAKNGGFETAQAAPIYSVSSDSQTQVSSSASAPQSGLVWKTGLPGQQLAANQNNSVSVSDLAPAAGGEAKQDQTTAAPEAAPVNQWTGKERAAAKPSGGAYIWPVASNDIIKSFGATNGAKSNEGINIASSQGEPVWASADGEVVYADSKMKGYGNMVLVKHKGGKTTTYAHLSRISVEKYDRVKQGDIVGYVGATGNVNKPQLYFSVRDGTTAIDPKKVIDHSVAGL